MFGGVGWVRDRETERGCQNTEPLTDPPTHPPIHSPRLLPLLLFLLPHFCCQKAGKRSKWADMKGIPEILFLDAPSRCSLRHRYGNAESQIQPVPRLRRLPALIRLFSRFPFCLQCPPPTPPLPSSHPPSSSPPSLPPSLPPILCSCLSLAALGLPGR